MSVVIIAGGDGRRAITKLETSYHSLDAEGKASAVALLTQFVTDVDALCKDHDHGNDNEQ